MESKKPTSEFSLVVYCGEGTQERKVVVPLQRNTKDSRNYLWGSCRENVSLTANSRVYVFQNQPDGKRFDELLK